MSPCVVWRSDFEECHIGLILGEWGETIMSFMVTGEGSGGISEAEWPFGALDSGPQQPHPELTFLLGPLCLVACGGLLQLSTEFGSSLATQACHFTCFVPWQAGFKPPYPGTCEPWRHLFRCGFQVPCPYLLLHYRRQTLGPLRPSQVVDSSGWVRTERGSIACAV